jgi:Arc/MetJ family transcription regulator
MDELPIQGERSVRTNIEIDHALLAEAIAATGAQDEA